MYSALAGYLLLLDSVMTSKAFLPNMGVSSLNALLALPSRDWGLSFTYGPLEPLVDRTLLWLAICPEGLTIFFVSCPDFMTATVGSRV